MRDVDINRLMLAWFNAAQADPGTADYAELEWALTEVANLKINDAGTLWKFIKGSCEQSMTEKVKNKFANGPLADLMCPPGAQYIEEIETFALSNNRFKELLGRLAQGETPENIWRRIESIRGKPVIGSDFRALQSGIYFSQINNADPMSDIELNELVETWIKCAEAGPNSSFTDENFWALETVMGFPGSKPEELWRFILATYTKPMSDRAQAYFAADPLENLIGNHGPEFIDRIEQLAKQDELFKELLGGVWRYYATDDVWNRIEAVRGEPWGP